VHGNCWMRRFRQASGVGAMPAAELGDVVRARLAARSVPWAAPSRVRESVSQGGACVGCGGRIALGVIEYEVQFAEALTVRFHRACYVLWDKERLAVS